MTISSVLLPYHPAYLRGRHLPELVIANDQDLKPREELVLTVSSSNNRLDDVVWFLDFFLTYYHPSRRLDLHSALYRGTYYGDALATTNGHA